MTTTSPASTPVSHYSAWRILRLSSFQIGSAMSDILTASVWNRVLISDLGMPATPVGILLALQYLLLPISFWAGHRSDTTRLWHRRRTSYIWLGRGLMVLSFPLLGLSVRFLESGQTTEGWLLALVCFLLFGMGKLFSGSVYLALVRESAPPAKQGIAIATAETMLIAFFPIAAIAYGRWMETYDPVTFSTMILTTALIAAFFWWFAIVRVENQSISTVTAAKGGGWGETMGKFKGIWQDGRVRRFFAFLFIATFASWMQDNILEPFGADVFDLPAGQTTRFTGYWGSVTIVVLLICFAIFRKRRPETHAPLAKVGLVIMAAGMALLAASGPLNQERLLMLALLVFGGGFGLYSFGGISLMAAMSPDMDAGAYLGLWSTCILLSKGLGTFTGGFLRDLFYLALELSAANAYAVVFSVAALGLVAAAIILSGQQIGSFVQAYGRPATTGLELMGAD